MCYRAGPRDRLVSPSVACLDFYWADSEPSTRIADIIRAMRMRVARDATLFRRGVVELEGADGLRELLRLVLQSLRRSGACSTSAAFSCVTLSICVTAWLICSMPSLCSLLDELISATISVTWRMLFTTSPMICPASSTILPPVPT